MMDSNFDMDLAIEQGCDEAQKFIDQLRKNKQKDMGDVRLLDAFLRQIPIPLLPDRPKGALPLKGLGLGVVQSALSTPNSPNSNLSNVAPPTALPFAVKNGSARDAIKQLPTVSTLPSTNTGILRAAVTGSAQTQVITKTRQHITLQLNDGIFDTSTEVIKEVKLLQECLKDWGMLEANDIDGKFGRRTDDAVKRFQQKKSLEADGIVGLNTWAALLGVSSSEVEIIPRIDGGSSSNYNLNLAKIPSEWKSAATKYVPILVKAFTAQGIYNPHVFAYACATICYESSWDPQAINTTDAAAKTGYPGAGLAQITWKDNYRMATFKTGIDFVNHPEHMFDPEKSLRAKAAFYQENGMIPYIERGDYESAAGIYNAGRASFRSSYTRNVANDTPLWLPVFLGEGNQPDTSLKKDNKDSRDTADLAGEIKLDVEYYSQIDSKTSQAERMCFSSTCAMALKYLRPEALSGANADDTYLGTVFKYGDTIDPVAQVKALKSYGITAYYKQNLSFKDLDEQLMKGLPIAVGWLHHGSVDNINKEKGHWCLVVGRKAGGNAYYFMDPYGEADLVNGGYTLNEDGRYMVYSKRNWGPRWQVEGEGTGWGVIFEKPN